MKKTIEDIIRGGLLNYSDEPFFSWGGCSYCKSGGADVYECSGYRSLSEAKAGCGNLYEFNLCGECLNSLYYGEESEAV